MIPIQTSIILTVNKGIELVNLKKADSENDGALVEIRWLVEIGGSGIPDIDAPPSFSIVV